MNIYGFLTGDAVLHNLFKSKEEISAWIFAYTLLYDGFKGDVFFYPDILKNQSQINLICRNWRWPGETTIKELICLQSSPSCHQDSYQLSKWLWWWLWGWYGCKDVYPGDYLPCPPWHCARKYLPLSSLDMWDSVEKKKKITGTKSRQIIISCHLQQFLRHENQCRLQQNVQDVGETNI